VTPTLVFDLETIPDAEGLRAIRSDLDHLDDTALVDAVLAERQAAKGTTFLPHHLHKIIAIGCVFRSDKGIQVRCLGDERTDEARLIADFFKLIDHYTPQLVSWNGGGFDLPCLHYRAMKHLVPSTRYWENGDEDRDFKWNNYLSRYHMRHLDLMDYLGMFTGRANAPLDELAKLCGLPGKLGVDGSQVLPMWREGRLAEIRAYCETDVMNTYLLYARHQVLRGAMSREAYEAEEQLVHDTLIDLPGEHWAQYLDAWSPTA
jgi:predicted PolB exonuclease-like 3'-5' exonuclease